MNDQRNPIIWADCLAVSDGLLRETAFTQSLYAWVLTGGIHTGVNRRHQALKAAPNFIDTLRVHGTKDIDEGRPLYNTIVKALEAANKLPLPNPPRSALLHVGRCKVLGNYGPPHTIDALILLAYIDPSVYPASHHDRVMFCEAAYDAKAVFDFYAHHYNRAVGRITAGMKLPRHWQHIAQRLAAVPSAEVLVDYLARIYTPLLAGYWNTSPFYPDGHARNHFITLVHESLDLWDLSHAAGSFAPVTHNDADSLPVLAHAKAVPWPALDKARSLTIDGIPYTLIPLTSSHHLTKHGDAVMNCAARSVGVCLYQNRHMLAVVPTDALPQKDGVAPIDALMNLYDRPLSAELMQRIGTVLMAIKYGRLVRADLEIALPLLPSAQKAIDDYAKRFMARRTFPNHAAMLTLETTKRRTTKPNTLSHRVLNEHELEQSFQQTRRYLTSKKERRCASFSAWCNLMYLPELAAIASHEVFRHT